MSTSGNVTLNIDGLVTDINGIRGQVAALESRRYITEMWESEDKSKWYRKYSDGWVEQGVYLPLSNSGDTKIVTLPVTMRDTNYIITACIENSNTSSIGANNVGIYANSKTVTGFTTGSTIINRSFYICGYAAQ